MRTDAELLDLLYAAALGERHWKDFVCALDDGIPEGTSILFYLDPDLTSGALTVSGNIDQAWVTAFDSHYAGINPFAPSAAVRPIGRGVISEQMLPRAELEATEFYNDLLLPFGKDSAVGVTILREAGRSLLLSTMTSVRDADEKRPFADRLTRLTPHLRRAFDLYRDRVSGVMADQLSNSLDTVNVGVLMLSPGGAVVHQTAATERILEKTQLACQTPLGRFRFRNERADALLSRLRSAKAVPGEVVSMKLNGISIVMRRPIFEPMFDRVFGGMVTIILHDKALDFDDLAFETAAERYGLTKAEQRVLRGVVEGSTLNRIALRTGRSRETIKSQLGSIYFKTGVSRREALIHLVLNMKQ